MKALLLLLIAPLLVAGWGWDQKHEKVRLREVQVLTLRAGEMTTGRRSSPVPQLSCVGGSGSGRGWEPAVVQCYNRGWDGREVQWECNSDMEGTVRFGKVEVVCEGYDYAEDDFILAGSCGLEYTLELTKEGKQSGGGGWSSGQSNNYNSYGSNSHNYNKTRSDWSGLGDLIVLAVICIMIYAFYKTCIDSPSMEDTQYSSTSTGDYPSGGGSPGAGGWADPNRGYGENVHGFGNNQGGADCGGGARRRGTGAAGAGGGFWTGAATGGLLGYMFGNRNTGYNRGYGGYNRGWGGGGYSRGFTGTGGSWSGGSGAASTSSGTRTASGFGGTRRR